MQMQGSTSRVIRFGTFELDLHEGRLSKSGLRVRLQGHPIYFLETFIDPERFRGTCYRAANWVLMGKTTGRGKQSNSYVPNRSIKEVLGYPLTKRFRELLGGAA